MLAAALNRFSSLRTLQNGMTALHIAAETGRAERVKYLLSRGAAVDPVTNVRLLTFFFFLA